jgi:endonuclease/exonuclease/phosphatase family metal-dependent hydrolase
MRLRVLTFNVQHDAGHSRRTSLLNRELQRLAPGLVVLQEVCYPDQWDQLAELVADTGLNTTHQADVLGYVPPLAEAARERQALDVTDLDARHRAVLPTIIAGDFNATPQAASIRYLSGLQTLSGRSAHYHDAWAVAGDEPGYTWSEDNAAAAVEIDEVVQQRGHRVRIDYVFVGSAPAHPRARARIVAAQLVGDRPVDGVWLSDHAGVLVDLDIEMTDPL